MGNTQRANVLTIAGIQDSSQTWCQVSDLCCHVGQGAMQGLDPPGPSQTGQEGVRVPRALAKDTWAATHDGSLAPLGTTQQRPSGALVCPPIHSFCHVMCCPAYPLLQMCFLGSFCCSNMLFGTGDSALR